MAKGRWVYASGKPSASDKQAITDACEAFIENVLKPRFLPKICPTEFNYPIDIMGRWRSSKYRFMQRYRSDQPDRQDNEFDVGFARLDYMAPDQFDLAYLRHTERWHTLYHGLSLQEALDMIENQPHFHPLS